MAEPAKDLVPYEPDEDSLTTVQRWRYRMFKEAGFSEIDAHRLAISSADSRRLIRALDQGCSLELALEIFG